MVSASAAGVAPGPEAAARALAGVDSSGMGSAPTPAMAPTSAPRSDGVPEIGHNRAAHRARAEP
eukprot:8364485-Alexandrium_andersonii.AAC.1